MFIDQVFCVLSTSKAALILTLFVTALASLITLIYELPIEGEASVRTGLVLTSTFGLMSCAINFTFIFVFDAIKLDMMLPLIWIMLRILIGVNALSSTSYATRCIDLLVLLTTVYSILRCYHYKHTNTNHHGVFDYREHILCSFNAPLINS